MLQWESNGDHAFRKGVHADTGMMMDLIRLGCFYTVVNTQNYYVAAEELNLSQSSVSKHILQLEKELGVQLLNRNTNHTRKVTLTPAGEAIYQDVEKMLETWKKIDGKLSPYRHEKGLRIGSVNHLQKVGGMAPIISYMKDHPEITVAIQENGTSQLLEMLLKREIDVAIIAHIYTAFDPLGNLQNFPGEGYRRVLMAKDHYYLAVNRDHRLAAYKQVDWSDLDGENLIILDKSFSSNRIIREALDYYGCGARIAFETNGLDNIWGMVLENYGAALLSHKVIRGMKGAVAVSMKQPICRDTEMLIPEGAGTAVKRFAKYVEERME